MRKAAKTGCAWGGERGHEILPKSPLTPLIPQETARADFVMKVYTAKDNVNLKVDNNGKTKFKLALRARFVDPALDPGGIL